MRRIQVLAALFLATACHRSEPAQGPFEKAGRGLDTAADKTGHALTTAVHKTGEGVTTAAHATGRAFVKVGDKLEGKAIKTGKDAPPARSDR